MSGFERQAANYDEVAHVQAQVAAKLAARLRGTPARILEIGCGTGLLSAHLAQKFPEATLLLTDLSPAMLRQAERRLGGRAGYRVMDGQWPDAGEQKFDLIASSLVFQWFDDLPGALARLGAMLAPGGKLVFSTLGRNSFGAWRAAHEQMGLSCGLRDYVDASHMPWPPALAGRVEVEIIDETCPDARIFLRGMKQLGAAQSPARHRPLGAGQMRKLLACFEGGFTARYEVLFCEAARR